MNIYDIANDGCVLLEGKYFPPNNRKQNIYLEFIVNTEVNTPNYK